MPMATGLDPADLDPDQEVFWTLPMSIAWIAWRDPAQVRDQWGKYRKACWERAREESPGGRLLPLQRASVVTMSMRESAKVAFERVLFDACAEGKINAIGNDAVGRPVQIPAHEFSMLTLYWLPAEAPWGSGVTPGLGQEPQLVGFKDVLVFDINRFEPAYSEIKFRRDEIKRKWPVATRGKVGRPATYDWPRVKRGLEERAANGSRPPKDMPDLIELVRSMQVKIDPDKNPNDNTVRAAIKTHGLDTAAGMSPEN